MYVIHYTGVFQAGYLQLTFGKEREIPLQSDQEGIEFASKFRFKFIANLFCRIYNWEAERNFTFRTFKVKKI